ncbi:hypothetical protein BHE74_00003511 [Ensete ventricosum]|nr:hypothetical protein BHE74_00003511 [Ensete ventricosum]
MNPIEEVLGSEGVEEFLARPQRKTVRSAGSGREEEEENVAGGRDLGLFGSRRFHPFLDEVVVVVVDVMGWKGSRGGRVGP